MLYKTLTSLPYAASISHWLEKQRLKRELNKLSDHELKDIGLTRGDIDRMVEQEYGDKY